MDFATVYLELHGIAIMFMVYKYDTADDSHILRDWDKSQNTQNTLSGSGGEGSLN